MLKLKHDLRDKVTGDRATHHKAQARSHVAVVKHEATEFGGAGAVKSCATDLSATRDDEVTVAGGPNTDEQLRIQT